MNETTEPAADNAEQQPADQREAAGNLAAAPRSATLTRLRIAGFKSFPEPTTVEVLPGLTGIVGPNGCGKSNVVEALRWAMGESSARAMRGGEMDDVIFAGTATRPGRNLAEVTLSLAEAAGLAPPPHQEMDELEITRRINRGEGSSFRVNGREVRGRDVQTMFADIGSGARASAMVSQGRVATMIAAKPEERRQVLEEAAGIAGLRARRHEAELKLRAAEQNLVRAEDLLGQLEGQRQGLQRQARQAARYRNISGLVRGAEAEWLSLLDARARTASEVARTGFEQARAATGAAERAAEDATRRLFAAEQGLPAPREVEAVARTALERRRVETEGLDEAERRARAALGAAETQLQQLAEDLGHATRVFEDAEAALGRIGTEAAALEEAEASLPDRLAAAGAAATESASAAAEAERAANAATERSAAAAMRANNVAAELAAAEARVARAAESHAALLADHQAALAGAVAPDRLVAAQASVEAAGTALAEAGAALEAAELARAEAQAAAVEAERHAEAARAARKQIEAERSALAGRAAKVASDHAALRAASAAALARLVPPETLSRGADELAVAEAALGTAAAGLDAAEAARSAAQAEEGEAARRCREVEAGRLQAETERANQQQRAQRIAAQHATLAGELARAERERVPADRLAAAATELDAASAAAEAAAATLAEAEAARAAASAAHAELRREAAEGEAARTAATAEVQGLAALLAGQERAGGASSVLDSLSVPPGLEEALGIALGEALEGGLDTAAARSWHELPALDPVPELPGAATPLASLVAAPAALQRALSQIGLLPPGTEGAALLPALHPGQGLVTREGALWRWDGHAVRPGAPSAAAVRLQQRNQLRLAREREGEAAGRAAQLAETAAAAEQAERAAQARDAEARERRGAAEARLAAGRSAQAALAAREAEAAGRVSALAPQLERLTVEQAQVAAALDAAGAALAAVPELAAVRQERDAAVVRTRAAVTALDRARTVRRDAETALQAARAKQSELAAQGAEAESRVAAMAPQLERLAAEQAELETAQGDAAARAAALPDLDAAERSVRDATARLEAARAADAAGRAARTAAAAGLEEARDSAARLAAAAAEAASRIAAIEPQLARRAEELAEAEVALAAAQNASASLPDLATYRAELEARRHALAEARNQDAATRAALASLGGEADRLAAHRVALQAEQVGWAQRRDDAAGRLDGLRGRRDAAQVARDALAEAPDMAAEGLRQSGRRLDECAAAHREAAMALAAAEHEAREAAQARRDADTAFAAAREAQLRAEAALGQAETAFETVAARIAERLGDAELPPPAGELSDAAEEKARRKVERLTREREEMGPVNLRAELELEEVETRVSGINREREEIGAAIAKLRGSVGHLNREGRERLRAVFDQVDTQFRALFTRLFGGGRAHLALVGSDDPLEAGLEIFAEPPGKKLSALSLLSGGEQALTALSLIFAVFRCQPAPVCVLDEVDAPLDDANVERLCDLLVAMAEEAGTRFLVVTHHPLTMGRMHRLYGVTMQERGVSRLLSVDLGRAVEMVEAQAAE